MRYAITTLTTLPVPEAAERVRRLLADQGFGILTEIDLRGTLEAKLGAGAAEGLGDYLLLGACNPPLARRALAAEPEIGLLLPCNVVIRRAPGDELTTVQAIDPQTMSHLAGAETMQEVADDADARLRAALAGLPMPGAG